MPIESKIKKNVALAPLTTFKIGGRAEYFFKAENRKDFEAAVKWAKKQDISVSILGGGSKILANDDEIEGLVVKIASVSLKLTSVGIEAEAGVFMGKILALAAKNGFSGLEWAAGIPGISAGGSVWANAGAFGTSTADIFDQAEVFDLKSGKFVLFDKNKCRFAYRDSIFKKNKKLVIWKVRFKLKKENPKTVKEKIAANLAARMAKLPGEPSVGSIFKNLTLEELRAFSQSLADRAEVEGAVREGKVGAGWVIEKLNLKGKKIGGAMLSEKHANFIINTGRAKASDVIMLISFVKQQARDRLGVQLMEEVEYFGF